MGDCACLTMNGVGKPCAGEPHARFDRGPLERLKPRRDGTHAPHGKPAGLSPSAAPAIPNQRPTSPFTLPSRSQPSAQSLERRLTGLVFGRSQFCEDFGSLISPVLVGEENPERRKRCGTDTLDESQITAWTAAISASRLSKGPPQVYMRGAGRSAVLPNGDVRVLAEVILVRVLTVPP